MLMGRWVRAAIRRWKIIAALVGLMVTGLWAWVWYVPFPYELLGYDNLSSTCIVDRHGRSLRETLGDKEGRSERLGLDAISEHMIEATVHAEDRRFWKHAGVDPIAITRASWQNVNNFEVVSGASTITQQLVKMVSRGSRARTLPNKIEEAVLAIRLDKMVRKRSILEAYLNRAPYGNQLFGVGAASRMYFDKPAAQLTLAEAALLAGIPRAPSLNNPYADLERAKRVQKRVLNLMRERGAIDEAAYERALTEELTIVGRRGRVVAAHFTEHVLEKIGDTARPQLVETTLDLDLQHEVLGVVRAELARLEDRQVGQAACVVLDTDTGEVLAWVGSRDYWDDERGGANDGVTARRQPGSALKPFVYGMHLDADGSAADMLPDFPLQFPADDGVYIPKNYDRRYHGPVSVRDALASSLNIPAVVVAERVGVRNIHKKLVDLGMDTLDKKPKHYGLGIALGNGEVRLLDLARAYATLGRLGEPQPIQILKNPDPRTKNQEQRGRRAFSAPTSFILLDILTDDSARSRGFGRYSPLHLPYSVAAKTGTSADFRDNWAVGVTPDYTVAVWAGNFDGTPMNGSSGVTGAAPIMRQVFQALYPKAANAADVAWYERPPKIEEHAVCTLSGKKPGHLCPTTRLELFAKTDMPQETCDVHRSLRVDQRNGLLAGPDCPAEFVEEREFLNVPDTWAEWAIQRGHELAPARYSPNCPKGEAGAARAQPGDNAGLRISHPLDGDGFAIEPSLPITEQQVALRVEVPAERRGESLTWFVDGGPVATVDAPFQTFWQLEPGEHVIGVGRGKVEASVEVAVQ